MQYNQTPSKDALRAWWLDRCAKRVFEFLLPSPAVLFAFARSLLRAVREHMVMVVLSFHFLTSFCYCLNVMAHQPEAVVTGMSGIATLLLLNLITDVELAWMRYNAVNVIMSY